MADRLERWAVLLRCFDYEISHIAGDKNVWADLLSRWGAPGRQINRCARVSFWVATDRVQVEEILETHAGEDYPPEEQWPTMEQVRTAQQGVTEDT